MEIETDRHGQVMVGWITVHSQNAPNESLSFGMSLALMTLSKNQRKMSRLPNIHPPPKLWRTIQARRQLESILTLSL